MDPFAKRRLGRTDLHLTPLGCGTATLGGFIGAGGYGRPILRGLDKFDVPLMLEGAIPAALLALAIEGLFGLVERAVARHT